MKEKSAELPVSPQETQIDAPSFTDKLKIHKFKILGGILGILVFTGAVFGAYKFGQKQVQVGPQPTPTPVAVATPTPDPTANWKTYINKASGYSVKYPTDKLLRLICPGEELNLVKRGVETQESIDMPTCARDGRYDIEIVTLSTPKEEPKADQYTSVVKEDILVGGVKARKYVVNMFIPEPRGPGTEWYTEVFLNHDGKIYNLFLGKTDFVDIFDLIRSTFRFLE